MTDSNLDPFPLPDSTPLDVSAYHNLLKNFIANHKGPDKALQRYKVIDVTHYKKKRSVQHELLLATVLHDNGSHMLFRVERNAINRNLASAFLARGKISTDDDEQQLLNAVKRDLELAELLKKPVSRRRRVPDNASWMYSSTIGSDSLPKSILDSSPSPAQDCITFMHPEYKLNASWIKLDSVKPRSLYMYHLAIIATIVHQSDPLYTLLRHQCYWYAAMIIATIRRLEEEADYLDQRASTETASESNARLGPFPSVPSAIDNAEILMEYRQTGNSKKLSGTFCKIAIIHTYPVIVDLLWRKTQEAIVSWREEIEKQVRIKQQEIQDQLRDAMEQAARQVEDVIQGSAKQVEDLRRELNNQVELSKQMEEELRQLRLQARIDANSSSSTQTRMVRGTQASINLAFHEHKAPTEKIRHPQESIAHPPNISHIVQVKRQSASFAHGWHVELIE